MSPSESEQSQRDDAPEPVVSVIIPAYGVNAYIEEAIDSVLAQTFADYELFVVNDGAPEAETAALRRIVARYGDRVRYLERENGGQGAARNTAMRVSRAPYVAFLDGDDYWAPDLLERQLAVLGGDPTLALVYSDARIFGNAAVDGESYMENDPSNGEVTLESLLALRCNVTMSTIVARRDAIAEAGWFDEALRYVEDYDLWLRMAHRGMRMTYLRAPLAFRRVRATSLSANELKLNRVLLEVLERFARDHPTSVRERSAYERTAANVRSLISLAEGKSSLERRQYATAAHSLRDLRPEHVNWKLRAARLGLRTVPVVVSVAYRCWRRVQATRLRLRLRRGQSVQGMRSPEPPPAGPPESPPSAPDRRIEQR